MIAPPVPDGTLAGYRLVRKLAVGSRADVYLGVASTGAVALKVFAPSTSRESVGAELDALGRVDSPHLVSLLDVSDGSSGSGDLPVLVLERVAHGSVATLMAEREELECGEAITLLAPLAALVAELHDLGVAHGGIGATSVHLGSGHKPVLLGLGHCTLFAPGGTMAAIDKEPAAASDRDALAALALGILARVLRVAGGNCVRDLARWIESAPRAYEFPKELEERLLACAEPLPIAFSTERNVVAPVPARIAPPMPLATPFPTPSLGMEISTEERGPALPNWIQTVFLISPTEQLTQRALALARGVRPRFWVVAGAIAVGLLLAVVVLPAGTPASPHSALPEPVQTVAAPTSTPLPDDPVLASKILLAARTTCFRDLSILCLDAVDEASSAAFASDAALIQQIQGGGEIPKPTLATGSVTLVERMGDSALISLAAVGSAATASNPASILVMKTAAGWRIRDYLSGAHATGSSPTPASSAANG